MSLTLALIIMALLSYSITALLIRKGTQLGLIDHPNERSMHLIKTPRGGGLGFVFAWGVLIYAFVPKLLGDLGVFFLPAFGLAFVALIDDKLSLSSSLRLSVQVLAAIASVFLISNSYTFSLLGLGTSFSAIVAVLALVWTSNLFNFMDGVDGIAGLQAICVFSGAAVLFSTVVGAGPIFILVLSLALALLTFLVWNWPPAKIFMGDIGSSFLGFVIALCAILGEIVYGLSCLHWVLLMGVFCFDTMITLIRRKLQGASLRQLAQAHRLHAYQRLALSGMPVPRILAGLLVLNSSFILLNLWVQQGDIQRFLVAFIFILGLLTGVYLGIERLLPMSNRIKDGKVNG